MIRGIPIEKITTEYINRLVQDSVPESREIEYKREAPGRTDKDKKEFLADVSAFANASGGDLFLGISEKAEPSGKSIPDQALGLRVDSVDEEVRRLEAMIRGNLEPTLLGFRIVAIDGFPEGPVILVRILRSLSSPHMITVSGRLDTRFYARSEKGKRPLDIVELRAAFLQSDGMAERARRFREDRLARIVSDQTPVELNAGAKTVLHVIPLSALHVGEQIDIARAADALKRLAPLDSSSWDWRFNLDGLLTHDSDRKTGKDRSYLQVFSSGVLETVDVSLLEPHETDGRVLTSIPSGVYEKRVVAALNNYLRLLRELEVSGPYAVMLTLLGVRGYTMAVGYRFRHAGHTIEKSDVILPEVIAEDADQDPTNFMRPLFDALWRACGFPRSLNYDENRNWKPLS